MSPVKDGIEALRIERHGVARRGRGGLLALLTAVAVVAVAAFLWFGAGSLPEVAVAEVRLSDAPAAGSAAATVLNASGYVEARRRATVASKVTGRLIEVRVEEGLPVAAGDVLARIDDSQIRAAFALAEAQVGEARRASDETNAQLDLARSTLARTENLGARGFASEADLDRDRTQVRALESRLLLEHERVNVAERELALKYTDLADTVVRAPFAGVVISKDAQAGEIVSPVSAGGGFTRTGICTLVDMGSLEIEVDVNEAYIARVSPGQPVEAVLDAYPEWKIPARVITTIPAADREKATVLVRIAFDRLDPRILPDMGVKVAFLETADDAARASRSRLVVPRSAVREEAGRSVVFVLQGERLERRAIRTGAVTGEELEVLSGLAAGERVVTSTLEGVADGARVRVAAGSGDAGEVER